jgi:dihydrofolate reductase
MNRQGIIGIDNQLPWSIPSDLKHFKEYTMGATIVMGRKTFESIGSKPLPGRVNVVLSTCLECDDVCVLDNVDELAKYPLGIVMGGEQLYRQALALDLVEEICLTLVDRVVAPEEGQYVAYFPVEYLKDFVEVKRTTNEDEGYDIIWYQKQE